MHAIKEKPVVVNGQIVIRPIMVVALTYDHRLLDGREAVTFLGKFPTSNWIHPISTLDLPSIFVRRDLGSSIYLFICTRSILPYQVANPKLLFLHSKSPGLHRRPKKDASVRLRSMDTTLNLGGAGHGFPQKRKIKSIICFLCCVTHFVSHRNRESLFSEVSVSNFPQEPR